MVEEGGWRRDKSFHLVIGSPGQQFPSYSAWELPGLSSLIFTVRLIALYLGVPLTACWWLQVIFSSQDQPGHVSACPVQEAGRATVPLAYRFHQSKQKQLASHLNFEGPSQGHMENCQREPGEQGENAASSSPPCWEVFMHRKLSRRNDSSNHDNVSSTTLAGLPQGLTLFHTKSVSPFFWCALLIQW